VTGAEGLHAEGLRAELSGRAVLDGVTLTLRPRTVLGLVGPNGAGKSTLLRALAGLLRPTAGTVTLDDRPLRAYRTRQLATRIAYLPQSTELPFDFTAREVVLLGRHPHTGRLRGESPADHAIAADAMRAVGITHLAGRAVPTLSGGERQLVYVAKALAQRTDVMLADEPVSALDLRHQLTVLELLRERAGRGAAVAVVLHDLSQAARYCDELLLLHDGHIAACGKPADVLTPDALATAYGVRAAVRHDDLTGAVTVIALKPC
jgi:iron complex transport system ATP-binding protein